MTPALRFILVLLLALMVGGGWMGRFTVAVQAGETGLALLLGLGYVALLASVGGAAGSWIRSRGRP